MYDEKSNPQMLTLKWKINNNVCMMFAWVGNMIQTLSGSIEEHYWMYFSTICINLKFKQDVPE